MHKILVIDSGRSSVRKLSGALKRYGFELIPEKGLKSARRHLRENAFDILVIRDSLLKGNSSIHSLNRRFPDIPKIILRDSGLAKGHVYAGHDIPVIVLVEPVRLSEFRVWAELLLRNKILREDLKRLSESNDFIREASTFLEDSIKIISDSENLDVILRTIMDRVRTMTGARTWSLLFNDEPFCDSVHFHTSQRIRKVRFRKGIGISGYVLENDTPVLVNDASKERRYNEETDRLSSTKVESLVCVPLKVRNRSVGILRLVNKKKGEEFNDNDMYMLLNAARCCSIAIERAFLYEEIKNDDLTNLYNFRYLNQVLDMEVERALRYGAMFSIIFMDIDNFKSVNDRYGHLIGSRLLIEISKILQRNLRKIDIITRYGGDEFVIILPETPHDSCFFVADRLRRIIAKNRFLKNQGYSIRLTASFGVASFPDIAKTKEDLLNMADKAMYRGKLTTKNIVYAAK